MLRWRYKATTEKETGYEDVMDQLTIGQYAFQQLDDKARKAYVDNIVDIMHARNIFPIFYYNEEGILKEIQKVIDKEVKLETFSSKLSLGNDLLDFMFPNLHLVRCGGSAQSPYSRFHERDKLYKCIDYYLWHSPVNNARTMFMMPVRFLWQTATNFLPLRAKAIYEKFCPENGKILDYSCGFGGRMLGALSSKKNFIYHGCEPCTETYQNLLQLGSKIEKVTGRTNSFSIMNQCSEDASFGYEEYDFIFSCPPYYKAEHYSDEETQCTNRYHSYAEWLEKYVKPTILNCYNALKTGCYYGIVISNVAYGGIKKPCKDDWLRIALEVGFTNMQEFSVNSRSRSKDEKLYIFTK